MERKVETKLLSWKGSKNRMSIYQSLPSQLAKENKKFQYKLIKSGARANQYETPMDWLKAGKSGS